MAPQIPRKQDDTAEDDDDDDGLIDLADAGEEIPDDPDHIMDEGGEGVEDGEDDPDEEIQLQNDSIAHFDHHKDSIFCIAQHPLDPEMIVTGSGDDTACIFDLSQLTPPLLPPSYESNPSPSGGRPSLRCYGQLTGHTDSINAIAFTLPYGAYLLTAGMDGRLRAYCTVAGKYEFTAENQEVQEINFLSPCPHPSHHNTFALGASDGSIWVYRFRTTVELEVVQVYYLHTASCSAGAWTPDGKLLATVSEDGSFYVYDVFGEVAAGASGVGSGAGQSQAVVALTAEDQRFAVEGGLYSVAIAPTGAFAVVGGAEGMIRVVGLPRLEGAGFKQREGGSSEVGGGRGRRGGGGAGGQQAGQILASLQVQSDGVESLSFSAPPLTLLAAGSVDGSIVLFDTAHRFAVRRHIRDAHEGYAVVKVEFMDEVEKGHLLTSCGMDGVVRRFDTRGGTAAAGQGLLAEWRGHRGGGEKGGVLGFVQKGGRIVTAGDDSVSLVFDETRHSRA